MYQFDYSEICHELFPEDGSKSSRIAEAIELIEAAEALPPHPHEWLGVLSDFRKLWLTIMDEAPAAAQDQLPPVAQILREIERCRFHKPEMFAGVWRGMWPQ